MEYVQEGNFIYTVNTVGANIIKSFYDNVLHVEVDYIDSVLYFTVKDYLNTLNQYTGPITASINGVDQTINIDSGVGTFAIESSLLQVTTKQPDMRNGTLSIGAPPDRVDELEKAQADLMFLLIEKGVL